MFWWSEGICLFLSSWALDHQCILVSVSSLGCQRWLWGAGLCHPMRVGRGERKKSSPGAVLIICCCPRVPFEETVLWQVRFFFLFSPKVQVIFQHCFYESIVGPQTKARMSICLFLVSNKLRCICGKRLEGSMDWKRFTFHVCWNILSPLHDQNDVGGMNKVIQLAKPFSEDP